LAAVIYGRSQVVTAHCIQNIKNIEEIRRKGSCTKFEAKPVLEFLEFAGMCAAIQVPTHSPYGDFI